MGDVLTIVIYILISSVKFAAGPPFAYYNNSYNFTYFEIIIYSVIGGMFGVVVFTFFSRKLIEFWDIIKLRFKKIFKKKPGVFSPPETDYHFEGDIKYSYAQDKPTPRKIFNRRSRKIVRLWTKYGEFGVAFLTPIILSIPLGTFIATRYFKHKGHILLYMFISIVFWSVLMTSIFYLYDVHTVIELEHEVLE